MPPRLPLFLSVAMAATLCWLPHVIAAAPPATTDLSRMHQGLLQTRQKAMPLAAFLQLMGQPQKMEPSPFDPKKTFYQYTNGTCSITFNVDNTHRTVFLSTYVDYSNSGEQCRFNAVQSAADYQDHVKKYGEPIAKFIQRKDNLPSHATQQQVITQLGQPTHITPNKQGHKDMIYKLGPCQFTITLDARNTVDGSGYLCVN